ncbi:MAG: Uma2 family endonuclease [Tepidisphaerales bacterium]
MKTVRRPLLRVVDEPEPAWHVAYLFPPQGQWTEDEYLALDTNRLVELSDGVIEVLPMPTTWHQLLVAYLHRLLSDFASARDLGTALFAALPVRLWRNKFREPDVVFMLKEHENRIGDYWERADLVMEVVSPDDESRKRDLKEKRREYARAGIPEYWIVDPQKRRITVLRLVGKRYVVHGEFGEESIATSHLLPGFSVDVSAMFAQATRKGSNGKGPRRSRRSS